MNLTRRELFSILPAGAASCAGCTGAAFCVQPAVQSPSLRSGEKADMTWDEIFQFSYSGYIGMMKKLALQAGEDRLLEMIKRASTEAATEHVAARAAQLPKRDLAAYIGPVRTTPLFQHALVYDVVEESASVFELRVRQCLWARTFRAADAATLGYATICHGDFAAAPAFNPKLKLTRTKTLMEGHEFCNHRYAMET